MLTISPLLPIDRPEHFFRRLDEVADAVVIGHFVKGDGTPDGRKTRRTRLPAAMGQVNAASIRLPYRDEIVNVARREFSEPIGINIDGFAGRFLYPSDSAATAGPASDAIAS